MVKVLVPIDYSNCSIAALKHAASLARGSDGSLLILNVVESGSESLLPSSSELEDPSRQEVARLLQSFSESRPPLQFQEVRTEGIPVPAILSAAAQEHVDLIVMGTTGRTGFKRLLLGSVAEEVCRRATCPVLTLKAQPEATNGAVPTSVWERWTTPAGNPIRCAIEEGLNTTEINDNSTLALIARAISARASDIHIDPMGREFNVRFRIDGQLRTYCHISNEVGRSLLTQMKVTANLDIADPFHAKEGRLALPEVMQNYEVRITAVPVIDGEAVSLRVLSRNRLMRSMEQLGLSIDARSRIEQVLRHGEGIVLVTGPTGSGKTTTLYSMLHALDDGTRNIVSIEDPVEYDIPTFRQLAVDLKHGITMTNGLRTLLRLDPDVVFVGEVRDAEAAETAMRAASSGKYVFSSLHTRDVASTVTALRDLHIDGRSLAGNLAGIISQRLVRRLCRECSQPAPPTQQEAAEFQASGLPVPHEIRHRVGCAHCEGTGYFDRIGLFEVLTSDDALMSAIEQGQPEDELRRLMHSHDVSTLHKDALQKVADGLISFDEIGSMTTINLCHPSTSTP